MPITDSNMLSHAKFNIVTGVRLSETRFGRGDISEYAWVTDEDVYAVSEVAELHFPVGYTFPYAAMVNWLAGEATARIDRHGDTNYEDQPANMNRFAYQLQYQIDPDEVQAQADHIRSMPLVEVFKTTKKLKCSVCKMDVKRGEIMVYTLYRHAIRRGSDPDISGKPTMKRYCCSNSECLNKIKFRGESRNAPVVNSGGDEAADVATELQSIQRNAPPYPRFEGQKGRHSL